MAGEFNPQPTYSSSTPGSEEDAQYVAEMDGVQDAQNGEVPAMGMGGGMYDDDDQLRALFGGPQLPQFGALSQFNTNNGDYNG